MKTPCHGCMSRHEKCHSDCEKYLVFRERLRDAKKRDEQDREAKAFFIQRRAKSLKVKHSLAKK